MGGDEEGRRNAAPPFLRVRPHNENHAASAATPQRTMISSTFLVLISFMKKSMWFTSGFGIGGIPAALYLAAGGDLSRLLAPTPPGMPHGRRMAEEAAGQGPCARAVRPRTIDLTSGTESCMRVSEGWGWPPAARLGRRTMLALHGRIGPDGSGMGPRLSVTSNSDFELTAEDRVKIGSAFIDDRTTAWTGRIGRGLGPIVSVKRRDD